MGILETLGLTEADLESHNHPPSVAGEPIPLEDPLEEDLLLAGPDELGEDFPDYPDEVAADQGDATGDRDVSPVSISGQVALEGEDAPGEAPAASDGGFTDNDFFQQLTAGKFDAPKSPAGPPAKPKKSKRVAYSVACTLHVSGSDYEVQPLPAVDDAYDKAYRLNKVGAQRPTGYNVVQSDGEITCECYDFRYRQESAADSRGCKHIRALVDMGMFAAPPPDVGRRQSFD